MTPLSPEQKEYKEATLNHLLASLPMLQGQLLQETRAEAVDSLTGQLEDMQVHIDLLQQELAANAVIEPVADELCKQAANALVKQKFYLARKFINKLETIEPFYPALDRLRQDADSGQVSRRTRSITQGNLPSLRPIVTSALVPASTAGGLPAAMPVLEDDPADEMAPKGGIRQFFQLHIVLSCMVVLLIFCVMVGVGGFSLLEWLIEGL